VRSAGAQVAGGPLGQRPNGHTWELGLLNLCCCENLLAGKNRSPGLAKPFHFGMIANPEEAAVKAAAPLAFEPRISGSRRARQSWRDTTSI